MVFGTDFAFCATNFKALPESEEELISFPELIFMDEENSNYSLNSLYCQTIDIIIQRRYGYNQDIPNLLFGEHVNSSSHRLIFIDFQWKNF